MKEMAMSAARGAANAVSKGGGFTGAVVGGMRALSESAGAMAPYGGKGNFGANALSFANAAGGKAMSMMGQAVKAGTNAAMYRNPVYQGYQEAISLLGNKSNGLLTRPNANSGGGTPEEILKNLSKGQTAPTVTQKISDTASTIKNITSVAAQGVSNTANNIKDAVQDLSQRVKK